MRTSSLIIVAIVVAGLSGLSHGILVDRWGVPSNVRSAAEQIENLQLDIEGWTGDAPKPLDEQTRKVAGAEGYFSRRYTENESGATMHVTILCGRPGPISLHTPLYCFELAGMKQLSDETHATLSGGENKSAADEISAEFWSADFRPAPSVGGPEIKTFWSWSTDGQSWSTPEDPRLHYANEPYLYRLYFTAPIALFDAGAEAGKSENSDNSAKRFMRTFLNRFAKVTQKSDSE